MARKGSPVTEIAKALGIRYQHVRKVLLDAKLLTTQNPRGPTKKEVTITKPTLQTELLLQSGFQSIGYWTISEIQELTLPSGIPKIAGVYAFGIDGIVQYVGVATMGLSKRLYFYGKPGVTQKTSIRINAILKDLLGKNLRVEVLIATPEDFTWNGLPVHGSAGLELGLIKTFTLPWNIRSAG